MVKNITMTVFIFTSHTGSLLTSDWEEGTSSGKEGRGLSQFSSEALVVEKFCRIWLGEEQDS